MMPTIEIENFAELISVRAEKKLDWWDKKREPCNLHDGGLFRMSFCNLASTFMSL